MVEEARKANHSWAQIAEALGITRQAAQARFGGRDGADAAAHHSPIKARGIAELSKDCVG